ncbi:transposase [Streptomyces sp. NPDC004044]
MARPSKYSAEFRSDAIALWRASVGRRTFKDVVADLNVNPETPRTWVRDADGHPVAAGSKPVGLPPRLPRRWRLARWPFGSGMVCLIWRLRR